MQPSIIANTAELNTHLRTCIAQARHDYPAALAHLTHVLRERGKTYAEQFILFQQAVPDLTPTEFDELMAEADYHGSAL